jgi:uracil-DNA glycosylase
MNYEELLCELRDCQMCPLHEKRSSVVPGVGSLVARLVFIAEGPGEDEDRTGIPFVGRAGQLFTKMLTAVHIPRNDVFITNIVKCRPPKNRNPSKEEIQSCYPSLEKQIRYIQPSIISTLGAPATSTILGKRVSMGESRGRPIEGTFFGVECILFPMYHPAYLLRAEDKKGIAWKDLQKLELLYRLKEV